MPVYEYHCLNCQKDFSLFQTYAEYGTVPAVCPECGAENVRRRIGRVHTAEGDKARLQHLSDDVRGQDSNQALGKVMRGISEQSGVALKPEYKEVISRLERGESRASIDKDYD